MRQVPSRGRVRTRVAVALLVAGALHASPAEAAEKRVSAIAFWAMDDPRSTSVSLQANEAAKGGEDSYFLFIHQRFCDTASNQMVFRGYSSSGSLPKGAFSGSSSLSRAALKASLPVTVSEQRQPSCSSTEQPTTVPQPGTTLTLDITWAGRGPIRTIQPGIEGRDATATGTITPGSVLGLSDLGPSDTGELRRH